MKSTPRPLSSNGKCWICLYLLCIAKNVTIHSWLQASCNVEEHWVTNWVPIVRSWRRSLLPPLFAWPCTCFFFRLINCQLPHCLSRCLPCRLPHHDETNVGLLHIHRAAVRFAAHSPQRAWMQPVRWRRAPPPPAAQPSADFATVTTNCWLDFAITTENTK